jgi:hypothetical protein
MALKVVPAGDERCDIHTQRKPARYICERCMQELGLEAGERAPQRSRSLRARARRVRRGLRRWRSRPDRLILVGGLVAALVVLVVVVVAATGGGGGGEHGDVAPSRTEAGVVSALGLINSPGGTGWTTPDGACWVVSIQFGEDVHPGKIAGGQLVEATNEDATVGAAVAQNDYTVSEAACVERIGAGLRAHF